MIFKIFSTHLVFNHIAKTGGRTLKYYLGKFGDKCGLKYDDFKEYGCGKDLCKLTQKEMKYTQSLNMVIGHQVFGLHSLFPRTVYITMFRHPVSTFVSSVFQTEKERPKKGDFQEYTLFEVNSFPS